MKKTEWPGIATAVGIVLILTVVTWLGISGPVDFNRLQPWQPLLVGILAIGSAIIAYLGATSNVRLTKRNLDRMERRKKLGIYLRAEHACIHLSFRARGLAEKTRQRQLDKRTVLLDELKMVADVPDLAETWANLEMFPTKAAFKLSQVQSCIRTLSNFTASQPSDTKWDIGPGIPYSGQMKVTHDVANDLRKACEEVLEEIQPITLAMSDEEHG